MNIYPGHESVIKLVEALATKGYERSDYYIIILGRSNYYAVTYENQTHNICFGKDDVWFWDDNTLKHISFEEYEMPYFGENATSRLRNNLTMKLYGELLNEVEFISLKKYKHIESERPQSIAQGSPIHLHYTKILARTFMDKAFKKNEVPAIKSYILMNNTDKIAKALFIKNPILKSFNPFTLTGYLDNETTCKIGAIFAPNGELIDYKLLK